MIGLLLVFEKMAIYFHGEVQPHRKSRHFLMRALMTPKLCAVEMRNAILGNDLKICLFALTFVT